MNILEHLEKLPHFKAVAQEGSFLQAGQKLGQSQPTLIYSVRKLEDALGKRLFFRSRKGTCLTEEGLELLKFTRRLEGLAYDLEESIDSLGSYTQEIRIASHNPITSALLVPIFDKIKVGTRKIKISFHSTLSSRELIQWVREGKVDLALVAEPDKTNELESKLLLKDHYGFFCNKEFKLPKVLTTSLLSETQLIYVPNSVTGKNISLKKLLSEKKIKSENAFEFNDYETVKSMAIHGHGVAILPKCITQQDVKSQSLLNLQVETKLKKLGSFSINIVYRSEINFSAVAKAICKLSLSN